MYLNTGVGLILYFDFAVVILHYWKIYNNFVCCVEACAVTRCLLWLRKRTEQHEEVDLIIESLNISFPLLCPLVWRCGLNMELFCFHIVGYDNAVK